MLRPQHFHNKSHVVNCYWFNLNSQLKLLFCSFIKTNNNLLFRICCENVMDIAFLI